MSLKWVVKQQRQLATSMTHLAQVMLTTVSCTANSKSFSKETRALKTRRVVASHRKLMTIESHHQSQSSYNYTRRTQRQPFCGHLAFEANWKGEKAQ